MGTAAPPLGIIMSHTSPHGFTASSAFHIVDLMRLDNKVTSGNVRAWINVYNSQSDYSNGKDPIDRLEFTFTLAKNTSKSGAAGDILEQCYTALVASSDVDGTDYAGGSTSTATDSR